MRRIILSLFISNMLMNVSCKADEPFSIETKMASGFSRGVQSTLEDVPIAIYHEDLGKNLMERVKSLWHFCVEVINNFSGLEVHDKDNIFRSIPSRSTAELFARAKIEKKNVEVLKLLEEELNPITDALKSLQDNDQEILKRLSNSKGKNDTGIFDPFDSLEVLSKEDKKEDVINALGIYSEFQSNQNNLEDNINLLSYNGKDTKSDVSLNELEYEFMRSATHSKIKVN